MNISKLALAAAMCFGGAAYAQQAGVVTSEDGDNARKLLADMTDDALEKSDVDDIVEWFAQADRDRIGELKLSDEQVKTLNGRIQQFHNDWNAKYGHNFNVDDGAGGTFKDGTFSVKDNHGKLNLVIPAMGDMKEVMVPLVREGGGVRLDVADSMSGTDVYNAVLNVLTKCDSMKDKWPSDENMAYRTVNAALLSELGKGADKAGGM